MTAASLRVQMHLDAEITAQAAGGGGAAGGGAGGGGGAAAPVFGAENAEATAHVQAKFPLAPDICCIEMNIVRFSMFLFNMMRCDIQIILLLVCASSLFLCVEAGVGRRFVGGGLRAEAYAGTAVQHVNPVSFQFLARPSPPRPSSSL